MKNTKSTSEMKNIQGVKIGDTQIEDKYGVYTIVKITEKSVFRTLTSHSGYVTTPHRISWKTFNNRSASNTRKL